MLEPESAEAILTFEGVSVRAFPLRASEQRLQAFCDQYLNVSPFAYFRPALPAAFFCVLNYGQMTDSAEDIGWVAQHEFLFMLFLEYFKPNGKGELEFQDWVSVTPFVFVDDELSVQGGRDVGWPKILASVDSSPNPWLDDPRLARELVHLKTLIFPRLYSGDSLEEQTLLELRQEEANTILQVPPNPRRMLDPLVVGTVTAYENVAAFAAFLNRVVSRGLGYRTSPEPTRVDLKRVAEVVSGYLLGRRPLTAITLKQFQASQPDTACFQALGTSSMLTQRFNGGGPLGETALALGDLSGGFRLYLHHGTAFPIVETLGLLHQIEPREPGRVVSLTPFLPFWFDADMRYVLGGRLGYQTPGTSWSTGAETASLFIDKALGEANRRTLEKPGDGDVKVVQRGESIPYNTSLGPLADPVGGALELFDCDIKVLPLPISMKAAREATRGVRFFLEQLPLLRQFDTTGEGPESLEVVDIAPFPDLDPGSGQPDPATLAFMVVTHNGAMSSVANNIGSWAESTVELCMLVKAVFKTQGEHLTRFFVCPMFDFASSAIAAMTGREARGLHTNLARIEGGRSHWLKDASARERLLEVSAEIFPALDQGQTTHRKRLLEVRQASDELSSGGPLSAANLQLVRRSFQALEQNQNDSAIFDYLAYKNFLASDVPEAACYAGFVAWSAVAGQFRRPAAERCPIVPDPLPEMEVLFLKQPTFDLIGKLGLLAEHEVVHPETGDVYVACQAVHPFRVRCDLRWGEARDLFWQALYPKPIYVMNDAYSFLTSQQHQTRAASLDEMLGEAGIAVGESPPGPKAGGKSSSKGRKRGAKARG